MIYSWGFHKAGSQRKGRHEAFMKPEKERSRKKSRHEAFMKPEKERSQRKRSS